MCDTLQQHQHQHQQSRSRNKAPSIQLHDTYGFGVWEALVLRIPCTGRADGVEVELLDDVDVVAVVELDDDASVDSAPL